MEPARMSIGSPHRPLPKGRLALVDQLFCWPPRGGADVDIYHVAKGLSDAGLTVKLFGLAHEQGWDRGAFDPGALPFPAERIVFTAREFQAARIAARVRKQVDAWAPDWVFLCDGFFLKPALTLALAGTYPVATRFFAYELACHRDILHFKDGAPCPCTYLNNPEVCRPCALERLGPEIKRGHHLAWVQEYLAAGAYAPEYHPLVADSLARADCAIVSNEAMAAHASPPCGKVFIVPGGADMEAYPPPHPPLGDQGRKVVFMSGRAEDPAKGLSVLLDAAERLWESRQDFVVWATAPESEAPRPYYRPLGWCDAQALREAHAAASVCVVPSIWEEPFGLTALEAMASGRPVCASRTGGLARTVVHGETGLHFPAGDAGALADCLDTLLDDPGLCARMGEAGRARVEAEYTWDTVVRRYYPPILEWLDQRRRAAA